MREILSDAEKNKDAGLGRAERRDEPELPKRFYSKVTVADRNGGHTVLLDGRVTKTPGKAEIVVPRRDLAEAMAVEWEAQTTHIDPRTMPLVRLVNSGVEGGADSARLLRDEIVKYAGTDLTLFRADSPQELVAEQDRQWDPVLTALARHFDIRFQPVVGIIHEDQPQQTLSKLAQSLDRAHHLTLISMASITGLTGSGLISIALREKLMEPDAAWNAAHVDEDHNIRLWGEDAEAAKRRAKRREEFDAAMTVLHSMETGD